MVDGTSGFYDKRDEERCVLNDLIAFYLDGPELHSQPVRLVHGRQYHENSLSATRMFGPQGPLC